jgi:hypothetical protein
MSTNPHFRSTYNGLGEQSLISNLMKECIQIQGYDIFYLPRENVAKDYLFGEDTISLFRDAIALECYIKDVESYQGNGHILSKFGLDVQDDLTIQIHQDRFKAEISSKFNHIVRPRDGDLIYFGLDTHSIFEISFVDNKVPFFQAGTLYLFEINLKRFVYGAETITTGLYDIDDIMSSGSNVVIELGVAQSTSTAFVEDELVYQSSTGLLSDSTASGTLILHVDNTITLRNVKGEFEPNIKLYGKTSGTIYTFPIKSDDTFDDTSSNRIADNVNVRKEGNSVIDFTETNPFLDNGYD